MLRFLTALWNDESGNALPEYGLVLALIAIVAITGLTALGTALDAKFTEMATKISSTGV